MGRKNIRVEPFDQVYSISGDLIYKLSREFQIGPGARDLLDLEYCRASSVATVVMLGVRLQR